MINIESASKQELIDLVFAIGHRLERMVDQATAENKPGLAEHASVSARHAELLLAALRRIPA